MRQRRRR
ncbi:hypothetical protein E2C01_096765 [Portunus trituberculatus]|nr:hypothetical protein [Portunus trituberculatus]